MTIQQEVKELVGRGRLGDALDRAFNWAGKQEDTRWQNDLLMQMSRFNGLQRSERMGLVSYDQVSRTRNQIQYALLSIMTDIDKSTQLTPTPNPADGFEGKEQGKALKLFISYAREDRSYVEVLEAHLSALLRSGHIDSWSDSKILPGQAWQPAIEKEIRSADVILLMLSADFLNSKFINSHEIPWAKLSGARIIPVLARPCDWEYQFGDLQALPKTKEGRLLPLSRWEDKDEGYLAIVKGLRRLLEKSAKAQ